MYAGWYRLTAAGVSIVLGLFVLLHSGCGENNGITTRIATKSATSLRLASTTSTRDSGLLDVLLPVFEERHDCRVDLIAVGTGAALKLGEQGDVDAILCHAPAAERAFMQAGHGIRRQPFMHNYFLIAGPNDDPAGVKADNAVSALKKIAASKSRFVSRADDSGTHKREQLLWKQANGRPAWDDYIESGQGMGATLLMADEMNAYVLVDEGTWLKRSGDIRLVPMTPPGEDLMNAYAIIVVDPCKDDAINGRMAHALTDFLTSASTQQLIADYKVNGQTLFHPQYLPDQGTEEPTQ